MRFLFLSVLLLLCAVSGRRDLDRLRKAVITPSLQLVPLHSAHFRETHSPPDTQSDITEASGSIEGESSALPTYTPFDEVPTSTTTVDESETPVPVQMKASSSSEQSSPDDASPLPFSKSDANNEGAYSDATVRKEHVDDENSKESDAIREHDQELMNQEDEMNIEHISSEESSESTAVTSQPTLESAEATSESTSSSDDDEYAPYVTPSSSSPSPSFSSNSPAPRSHAPEASLSPSRLPSSVAATPVKASHSIQPSPVEPISKLHHQHRFAAPAGGSSSSPPSAPTKPPAGEERKLSKHEKAAAALQQQIAMRQKLASKMGLKEMPVSMSAKPSPNLLKDGALMLDDTEEMYHKMGLKKISGVIVSYINVDPNWVDVALQTDGDDMIKIQVINKGLKMLEMVGERLTIWARITPAPGAGSQMEVVDFQVDHPNDPK